MNPNEVRFAVDAMLQLLGKWLRLIRYDCASGRELFGRKLIELAMAESRWVLTRNRSFTRDLPLFLLSRADIHFVASEQLPGQLLNVVERFSLEPTGFGFTRCLVCNEPLLVVDKPHMEGSVPSQVFARENLFWGCSNCGRIYWRGSHVDNSIRRLNHWMAADENNR